MPQVFVSNLRNMKILLIIRSLWVSGKKVIFRSFLLFRKSPFHPISFNVENDFKEINNQGNKINTRNTVVNRNCLEAKVSIITIVLLLCF